MAIRIEEQTIGAVKVVRPVGPVVEAEAETLRHVLGEVSKQTRGRYVLDASAIPFVDSTGLELLLEASEFLQNSGKILKLCGLNETLREVLELTGLRSRFEYFGDTHSAVRSFL